MTPAQTKAAEYIDKAQECDRLAMRSRDPKEFDQHVVDATHWRRMAKLELEREVLTANFK